MDEDPQDYPHTAISTWSGFVYQGKLAVYYFIELMSHDYDGNRELKLQLESEDDFAIFHDDQCISLHQVKAYKDTLFSKYRLGIEKQKEKALEQNIDTAYFHVARDIADLPESFEQDYQPVKLYRYPLQPGQDNGETKAYCPLDEIDSLIKKKIDVLIRKTEGIENWKINFCDRIREALEAMVNAKVIAVHSKIHASKKIHQEQLAAEEFIPFSELCEVLEADEFDSIENEDYFLSRLQIDIGTYYKDFCDMQEGISQKNQDKLDQYLAVITDFNKEQMKDFLRAVMPHRKGKFRTLQEFKDQTVDRDSIRQGLFAIFYRLIRADNFLSERAPFAWQDNEAFYYPTGIHTGAESVDTICYDILQQSLSEDVECLFESGALVTTSIDRANITHVKFGVDAIADADNSTQGNSIISFQQMSLVSLNNIPENLKDAEID